MPSPSYKELMRRKLDEEEGRQRRRRRALEYRNINRERLLRERQSIMPAMTRAGAESRDDTWAAPAESRAVPAVMAWSRPDKGKSASEQPLSRSNVQGKKKMISDDPAGQAAERQKQIYGYHENVTLLPEELTLPAMLDTGHGLAEVAADNVKTYTNGGEDWVEFDVPTSKGPVQFTRKLEGMLSSSKWIGPTVMEPVVKMKVQIGTQTKLIAVSLSSSRYKVPLILGKPFLREFNAMVDPSAEFKQTRTKRQKLKSEINLENDGKTDVTPLHSGLIPKLIYGAVENVTLLPEEITLKAIIDTGTGTSLVSADNINKYTKGEDDWVEFDVPTKAGPVPFTRKVEGIKILINPYNSAGLPRYFVKMKVRIGAQDKQIKVLLTKLPNNDQMLIGRKGLEVFNAMVDSSAYSSSLDSSTL